MIGANWALVPEGASWEAFASSAFVRQGHDATANRRVIASALARVVDRPGLLAEYGKAESQSGPIVLRVTIAMKVSQPLDPASTHRIVISWFATSILATAAWAAGGDRVFVQPNGRSIPLIKSETEMAITFDCTDSAQRCRRALEAQGMGKVEDLPGLPHSPHKILRINKATPSLRRSIPQIDPGIRELRPVYRFAGSQEPVFSTGQILVRVKPGLTDQDRTDLWNAFRLAMVEAIDGLADTYLVQPADQDDDEVFRSQTLAVDHRVVWAQPNFRVRSRSKQAAVPDQYFPQQWHLNNTGQNGGTAGADISAVEAWEFAQGQDILVGMFDDACDVDHDDLFGNYTGVGHDASLPSNDADFENPRPKQIGDEHGTAVMGLAVASGNTVGGRGVAFLSRFTVSRGLNELLTFQEIATVYTFARQQDVDVHINSWGLPNTPNPAIIVDAINTAFTQGRDPDGEGGDAAPLGMVIVFASGNGDDEGNGRELDENDDFAMLPSVIGVGASDPTDHVATFSDYGEGLDLIAPGAGIGTVGLTTTDNEDTVIVEPGYNEGGIGPFGVPDIDAGGRYTNTFGGTSASCPIVAGVAALILSANPTLTATDVRLILEHTADRVSANDADYENVSGHSLRYGFGRVNAHRAVQSAVEADRLGGDTWPDRVSNARLEGDTLSWTATTGANEFLIIESAGSFTFPNETAERFPVDGQCYSDEQAGGCATPGAIPAGVTVAGVVRCAGAGGCGNGVAFTLPNVVAGGSVAYAVYGRSGSGRYSWGVEASLGDDGSGGGDGDGAPELGPRVMISTSVVEGVSPLTVQFVGNAQSTGVPVDVNRVEWDFDVDDDIAIDATTRNATHEYRVPAGEVRTFIARLTMYDTNGNPGFAQIAITVTGSSTGQPIDPGQTSARIVVGVPGSVDSDVAEGTSPFEVILSIDTMSLAGDLEEVFWDLGDGATASSLQVPHTYINVGTSDFRIPVTATITTKLSATEEQTTVATRIITVHPGTEEEDQEIPQLPGTGVPGYGPPAPCGPIGILPWSIGLGLMLWMRWRR